MTKSFSELRKQKSNFKNLQDSLKTKKDYSDDRFWSAQMDKAGNGSAVIRFLPAPQGEELPYIKRFEYGFSRSVGDSKKWFINNCPTTIGGESPVLEANNKLWEAGGEDNEKTARDRKRRVSYFTNIMVIKDPANPDNEGKIFLFKFGPAIFKKLEEAVAPKFDDEDPINIFDFWEGANFKLRITKESGYANYDSSQFDKVKPLSDDDKVLQDIWETKMHSLKQFIAPDQFKSYEELDKEFNRFLGVEGDKAAKSADEDSLDEDLASIAKAQTKGDEAFDDDDNLDDISLEDDDDMEDLQKLLED